MYKYAPDIQSETRFIGIPKDLTGTCSTLILMEINYLLLIIKEPVNTRTLTYVNYLAF